MAERGRLARPLSRRGAASRGRVRPPQPLRERHGVQARAKANYPLAIFRPDLVVIPPADRLEWLGEFGLRQPRAFDLRSVALRADIIAQHKIQAAYQLLRGALILGADLIRLGRLSASLTGQLEVDDVTSRTAYPIIDATNPQEARQLFPQGLTWLFSIQPRISFDLRDNTARPTQGIYAEVLADFSHSIGTPFTTFRSDTHVNLIKLQGTLTGYVPLWGMVLALSTQAGQVFPLDSQSVTIAPKRFYLGGATTMRGYGENEMIPQDQRGVVAAQTERCASVLSGLGCSPQLQKLVSRGVMLPSQGAQASVLFRAELRVPLWKATELGLLRRRRESLVRHHPGRSGEAPHQPRVRLPDHHAGRAGRLRRGLQPEPRIPDQRADLRPALCRRLLLTGGRPSAREVRHHLVEVVERAVREAPLPAMVDQAAGREDEVGGVGGAAIAVPSPQHHHLVAGRLQLADDAPLADAAAAAAWRGPVELDPQAGGRAVGPGWRAARGGRAAAAGSRASTGSM